MPSHGDGAGTDPRNRPREVLTVGVVGIRRGLAAATAATLSADPPVCGPAPAHPQQPGVDMAGEGWTMPSALETVPGMAPTPSRFFRHHSRPCTPLGPGLQQPSDLARLPPCAATAPMRGRHGLRQRARPARCCGARCLTPPLTLAEAGGGRRVALLPVALFTRELQQGGWFNLCPGIAPGAYWLTHLQSYTPTAAMQAFGQWLLSRPTDGSQSREYVKRRSGGVQELLRVALGHALAHEHVEQIGVDVGRRCAS